MNNLQPLLMGDSSVATDLSLFLSEDGSDILAFLGVRFWNASDAARGSCSTRCLSGAW